MHKSYFRGLMSGLLPKDVSIDDIDSMDGLALQKEAHDKIVGKLANDHHVGMIIDSDGLGQIQFYSGVAQDKNGGVRFAPLPDEPDVIAWVSFED